MNNLELRAQSMCGLAGQIPGLVEEIAAICGLDRPDPCSYECGISLCRWPAGEVPKDLIEGEGETKRKGIDRLGIYVVADDLKKKQLFGRVVIYVEKCGQFALRLGCETRAVVQVVLLHELSHLVHHLGQNDQIGHFAGNFITLYAQQCSTIEDLAQKTTFATIHKHFDADLKSVFDHMSGKCPQEYQKWRGFAIDCTTSWRHACEKLRDEVLGLRDIPDRGDLKKFVE